MPVCHLFDFYSRILITQELSAVRLIRFTDVKCETGKDTQKLELLELCYHLSDDFVCLFLIATLHLYLSDTLTLTGSLFLKSHFYAEQSLHD